LPFGHAATRGFGESAELAREKFIASERRAIDQTDVKKIPDIFAQPSLTKNKNN
jgi:hypothetical protein